MKNKSLISAISVALLLFVLLSAFVSCSDKGGEDITTGTPETTTDPNVIDGISFSPLSEPVVLYNGKDSVYTFVRPESAPDDVVSIFQRITRDFRDSHGINLACNTDWVKPGTDTSVTVEVLVGNNDRDETRAVMKLLGRNDYAIVATGNKIVIAAHTAYKLSEAVEAFLKGLTVENSENGKTVLFSQNVLSRGAESTPLLIPDNEALAAYTIVYPEGSSNILSAANKLALQIKRAYGVELQVVSDSTSRKGPEIVVGDCSRAVAKALDGTVSAMQSIIKADPESRDLVIYAKSDAGTVNAVENFLTGYINKYYSNVIQLDENALIKGAAYTMDDKAELTEGADIRIMSFNLLCELWNDKPPIEGRDERAMAIFSYYAPDVVGIQEVSDNWYKALDKIMAGEYAFTDRKTERGETNFSTLIYNTSKVKLLDHGTKVYSQGNSPKLRLVTWGVFEKLDTGKQFIVVSTHWDLGSNPQFQEVHSNEMAAFCNQLIDKYGLPLITTGDYNSRESTSYIKNFLEKTGFIDSKYTATVVKKACKTYHDLGVAVSTSDAECIDHIFGSKGVEFLFYNVETSKTATDTSDHNPIYADIKLK